MARKKGINNLKANLKEDIKNLAIRISEDINSDEDKFINSSSIGLTIELYKVDQNYDYEFVLKNLVERCEKLDCLYAYCVHDKDYYTENTFDKNKRLIGKKGQLKKDHCHFVVQFNYPSVIGDFLHYAEGVPLRFVRKLRNSSEVDNMILYLSHIKYQNKYQYHKNGDVTGFIVSNRFDYCQWLHMTYKPKSAIKYCINHLRENEGKYVRLDDYFLKADEDEISYDEYLKTYRVVKDMILEHNKELEIISPKLERNYMDMAEKVKKEEIKNLTRDQKIREMAETFGAYRVEFDGKEMLVVNVPKGERMFDREEEKALPKSLFDKED